MSLKHTLSFQLYSARAFPPLEDQLSKLSALGFTNVEPYGGLYDDLDGLKTSLDRNGLVATSGHFDLEMLETDMARVITIAKTLGMEIVIAPWLDEAARPVDADGWAALGARLERLNSVLAAENLKFGWHNHDFEFRALADGTFPIEHLLNASTLGLELDVAWVVRAGIDPLPWLARYADRLLAVHVKDLAPEGQNIDEGGWAHLGQGVVDWPRIWPAVEATTARVAILEHDNPSNWLHFAEDSAASMLALQKSRGTN